MDATPHSDDPGNTTRWGEADAPPVLIAGIAHLGELIGGRFELLDELGRGAMGVVFRARDTNLDREVAVKLIATELADDPAWYRRFLEESRTVASLDHPGIVDVYERGEDGGRPFIAMRLVRGPTLQEILDTHGPLDLGSSLAIVRQLAAALDAAHRQGVVHGDVKPGNVLITGFPDEVRPHLVDFGLSRRAGGAPVTGDDRFAGTPAYAAPELVRMGLTSPASDIYALGCLVFRALTGEVPFPGDRAAQRAGNLTHPPPDLTARLPGAPPGLGEALAGALAKRPRLRPASAAAFADGLEAARFDVAVACADDHVHAAERLCHHLRDYGVSCRWPSAGDSERADRNAWAAARHRLVILEPADGVQMPTWRRALAASADIVVVPPGGPDPATAQIPGGAAVIDMRGGLDDPDARRRLRELVRPRGAADPEASTTCPWPGPVPYGADDALVFAGRGPVLGSVAELIDRHGRVVITGPSGSGVTSLVNHLAATGRVPGGAVVDAGDVGTPPGADASAAVYLRPLDRAGLREAIDAPAEAAGLVLEDGLARRIVDDLAGRPAAMPLLQHVLQRLWQERVGRTLVVDAYTRMGGAAGVAVVVADRWLAANPGRRAEAIAVLSRCVQPGEGAADAPRRAALEELIAAGGPGAAAVIDDLAAARLLVLDHDEDGAFAVLGHEILASGWGVLAEHVDDRRARMREERQLTQAAAAWRAGGDAAVLYRGSRLERWRELGPGGLSATELAFLDASTAEQERAEQAARRRRRIAWAAAALTIVTLTGLSILALVQRDRARAGERTARAEARARLAAEAARDDPPLALALALPALRAAPVDAAWNAVRGALLQDHLLSAGNLPAATHAVAITPDGRAAALGDATGIVRRIDTATGRTERTLTGGSEPVTALAMPTPETVVAGYADGRILAWPSGSGPGGRLIRARGARTTGMAHAGGVVLVTTGTVMARWDTVSARWRKPLRTGIGTLTAIAVDEEGGAAVVGDDRGRTVIVDLRTGARRRGPDGAAVRSIAATSEWIAIARDAGPVTVWAPQDGTTRTIPDSAGTTRLAADPQGRWLVSNDGHGGAQAVTIREAREWETLTVLPQSATTDAMAVARDGRAVTAGRSTATVRTWSLQTLPEVTRVPFRDVGWLDLDPAGERAAVIDASSTASLWNLGDGSRTVVGTGPYAVAVRFGPGGASAVLENDGVVEWRAAPGASPRRLPPDPREIAALGDVVLAGSRGELVAVAQAGQLTVRDLSRPGAQRSTRIGSAKTLVQFTPDGEVVVIAEPRGDRMQLRTWRWRSEPTPEVIAEDLDFPNSLAVSADGRYLGFASSAQYRAWLIDLTQPRTRILLGTHPAPVYGIALSGDGRFMVTGDQQGVVRLWDRDHAGLVATLGTLDAPVLSVVMPADARTITAASIGGEVRRWRCGVCVDDDAVEALADARLARDREVTTRLNAIRTP